MSDVKYINIELAVGSVTPSMGKSCSAGWVCAPLQQQTAPGATGDGETQATQPDSPVGSTRSWGKDWEFLGLWMSGCKLQVPEVLLGAAV